MSQHVLLCTLPSRFNHDSSVSEIPTKRKFCCTYSHVINNRLDCNKIVENFITNFNLQNTFVSDYCSVYINETIMFTSSQKQPPQEEIKSLKTLHIVFVPT